MRPEHGLVGCSMSNRCVSGLGDGDGLDNGLANGLVNGFGSSSDLPWQRRNNSLSPKAVVCLGMGLICLNSVDGASLFGCLAVHAVVWAA